MSHLQKNLHKIRHNPRPRFNANVDYTPVTWTKYFENKRDIQVGQNCFRVYINGLSGPLIVLLHGGGYSGLTWSLFSQQLITKVECQIVAIDLRGHGSTKTDDETNLSLETLADDVYQIIIQMFTDAYPPCVLIGHSMGGAVAVETAKLLTGIVGLCVIDVVEGTALESLSSMQSILRSRPSSFRTIEQAIQWSYKGGQTNNIESAKVSMPGQIKNAITGDLASEELALGKTLENMQNTTENIGDTDFPKISNMSSIDEIEENNIEHCLPPLPTNVKSAPSMSTNTTAFKNPSLLNANQYDWRIDLSKTECFWNGWFHGLSQKFLDIRAPKILLLANIQGLDTALTVGQMQGKFQLQVLSRSGHAIHEDQPDHVADIVAGFLVKQRLASSKDGFVPPLPGC